VKTNPASANSGPVLRRRFNRPASNEVVDSQVGRECDGYNGGIADCSCDCQRSSRRMNAGRDRREDNTTQNSTAHDDWHVWLKRVIRRLVELGISGGRGNTSHRPCKADPIHHQSAGGERCQKQNDQTENDFPIQNVASLCFIFRGIVRQQSNETKLSHGAGERKWQQMMAP